MRRLVPEGALLARRAPSIQRRWSAAQVLRVVLCELLGAPEALAKRPRGCLWSSHAHRRQALRVRADNRGAVVAACEGEDDEDDPGDERHGPDDGEDQRYHGGG